jgi:hypothetical protein
MTAKPEPAMVHSELSEKPDYCNALRAAKSIPTTLNYGWYNAFTQLDGYAEIPFSDISFETRQVAVEVKRPSDLGSSLFDGRLEDFKWHGAIMRDISHILYGFAYILHDPGQGLDQDAENRFLSATEWIARNSVRWKFNCYTVRRESSIAPVARSYLREFIDPKPRTMPPPVIRKELLQWPYGIQCLCMIDGIYIELAKQLLSKRSFWTIAIDAHDMELQAFCDEYNQIYNFGGKKSVRLTAIWTAFHFEDLYTELIVENVMTLQDPATFIKNHIRT